MIRIQWFGFLIDSSDVKIPNKCHCVLLKVEKTVWDWELMNDIKPIWQRPAKEVEEDEYTAFYKTFSKVSRVQSCVSALSLLVYINDSLLNKM